MKGSMKAVVLQQLGDPEHLVFQEVPTPEVTPGHVLVKVGACGVGYRDVIERRGDMPLLRPPIIQGHEFAGEVVAIGAGVARWQVGDRVLNLYFATCGICPHCLGGDERRCGRITEVFGLTVNGGYAEYVLAHERALERLLPGIPYDAAATLYSAIGVGFNNAANAAGIRVGERALVTGASGGVGSAALQTAKLLGATVWAVTSSGDKADALRALGADHVVVNGAGDFHKQVMAETNGEGVDVAIDCVGTPTMNGCLRSLRPYGRVVVVGNVDARRLELNLGYVLQRSLTIIGSDNVTRAALRQAMELVQAGRLKPTIHARLPLAQAADAHWLLERRGATGRLVLIP
jgi:NADPH:quinone reductase-like Zn-dependent oxidoreductase